MVSSRAPAALADGGVCRVCGEPLATPLVLCPACETPHHKDCWEYNRGCSIYGCNPPETLMIQTVTDLTIGPTILPPRPGAIPVWQDRPGRIAGATALLVGLGWGVLAAVQAAIPLATVLWVLEMRRQVREEEDAIDAPTDPRHTVELEMKSVRALLGRNLPDQLAQAYALFEQRHPRDSMEQDAQIALSRELIAGGFWVLGMEALDKVLAMRSVENRPQFERLWRDSALRDAAYAGEATGRGFAGVGTERLEGLAKAMQRASRLEPAGDSLYLVSASSQGIAAPLADYAVIPSRPAGPARVPSQWLVGPRDRASAVQRSLELRNEGRPAYLVRGSELTLAPTVLDIHGVHLSQKEARFRTPTTELVCAWTDVRAVIYGRIDVTAVRRESQQETLPAWGPTANAVTPKPAASEVVDVRPVIEIHIGDPAIRLRISSTRSEMFDYLGRRREYSHAPNMVLVAKDFARFGPGARVSHGLLWLMTERTGHGLRFADDDHFEQYVLWFWYMGTESARRVWRDVRSELGPSDQPTAEPVRGETQK